MKYALYPDPRLRVRDKVIALVRSGALTPEQAEEEAHRQGIGTVLSQIDADLVDPLAELEWPISMTLAWIRWREVQKVLPFWKEWASNHFRWHQIDGRWELFQLEVQRCGDLKYGDWNNPDELREAVTYRSPTDNAWRELQRAILDDDVRCFHKDSSGSRQKLPADVCFGAQPDQESADLVSSQNSYAVVASDVSILVQDLLRRWPLLSQAATSHTEPAPSCAQPAPPHIGLGTITARPLIIKALQTDPRLLDVSPAKKRNVQLWNAAKQLGGPDWANRSTDEKTITRAIRDYRNMVAKQT